MWRSRPASYIKRLPALYSALASRRQSGLCTYEIPASNSLVVRCRSFEMSYAIFNLPTPRHGSPRPIHSFADSLMVPIFNFEPYLSRTALLWYFQNCLVASFPAILLRILDPPGCSSRNPSQVEPCQKACNSDARHRATQ